MLYSISFSHINELIMQRMCYMLNALWCNGVVLCRSLRMSVVFKWRLPQNGLVTETDSTEVKLHTFLEWQTDSWAFQHSSSTSISLWEQNCRNPFGLLIFLGLGSVGGARNHFEEGRDLRSGSFISLLQCHSCSLYSWTVQSPSRLAEHL